MHMDSAPFHPSLKPFHPRPPHIYLFQLWICFALLASLQPVAAKARFWGLVALQQNVTLSSPGKWEVIGTSDVICIIMALIPGNRLICAERPHPPPYAYNPYTYDNKTGHTELTSEIDLNTGKVTNTHINTSPFCGGPVQAYDGNVLVVGGDNAIVNNTRTDNSTYIGDGRATIRKYNSACVSATGGAPCPVGSWTDMYSMTVQRWYPTVVTLNDGTVIIVGGSGNNLDLHFLNRTQDEPTWEFIPPRPSGPQLLPILRDTWPFNLFPMVYQLPSGRVWVFSGTLAAYIDPVTNTWSNSTLTSLDPWNARPHIYPYTPTGVILPMTIANNYSFTIQMCGGTTRSSVAANLTIPGMGDVLTADQACYQIQPDSPAPQWIPVDVLPVGRVMPDSVLLPDGKILYVNGANSGYAGGGAGFGVARFPVHQADIFDPTAPAGTKWSTGASATVDRMYHSTAVLIADGRVVTGGSEEQNWNDVFTFGIQRIDNDGQIYCNCVFGADCTDPYEYRLEAYSPPYMSIPNPPVIKSTPGQITYGSTFYVELFTDTAAVGMVSMIRYTSVTHSLNTDQRFIELPILSRNTTHLQLRGPPNGYLAPPGNWHLFVVSSAGRPGTAYTVMIARGAATSVASLNPTQNTRTASSSSSRSRSRSYLLTIFLVLMWFGL
ncbi:hypothetical protein SmJEL517_g05943 [Synchytrium microbalum]|uniref:Galactose oxidase-like Early set domain-containing protein n=1 Tax=Synchytrium microbalum TaxID=1806994 RepID=A0A507BT94_9FUNG|nr:uncharacterized protein SmJEL517_g05943 [Synchytrium microbalum]TPX30511.1 hypothetical protein SmJEL517_g05943 [Synchytrium microbalum]